VVDVIAFVQVCGSLLLRVGMQIDRFVPVQIPAQLTQVSALETDPIAWDILEKHGSTFLGLGY
jgi:hypothetical protein